MAYELVQQIIKDLRVRRIFLRLFYVGTPLQRSSSRPFSYTVDDVGVEIFGEINDVTDDITNLLTNNIEDIHAYLTETQPLPPKAEPESISAGDTTTQVVNFKRTEPTLVTEFERGRQGATGKDGTSVTDVAIENGLHQDDDHDEIEERLLDELMDEAGMEESKSQGDAWYIEQDAKRMAEKDGHDWSSLPYGRKMSYRASAVAMRKVDDVDEAKYQGREVKLGKPMAGDVKKFKVYVRDPKTGNVKKVNFGQKGVKIKKSNPARRKSFRARHNCSNPGPRTKARYWSCRKW